MRDERAIVDPAHREYNEKHDIGMLKVKDWPSEDDFRKKLPRHYTDFIQMLPFQAGSGRCCPPRHRHALPAWRISLATS